MSKKYLFLINKLNIKSWIKYWILKGTNIPIKIIELFRQATPITLNNTISRPFIKLIPRGNTKQNTTTGKNLLKPDGAPTTIRGVSWSYREDGAVLGERVLSNENVSDFTLVASSTFQPGSYIYSCFDDESTPGASKYQSNISINGASYWGTGNYSFVLNEVSTIRVVLRVYPNFTGTAIFKPMIRLSSIQESNYEPYTGGIPSPNPDYPQEIRNVTGNIECIISNSDGTKQQNYTLTLGNIELCKIGDYQDYLYKSNGKWYKYNTINKLVLNGSENWTAHGSIASWFFWDGITDGFVDNTISDYALSNYFTQKPYNTVTYLNNGEFAYGQVAGSTRKRFVLKDTDYTTVTDFKTWLSTHNTIVYYVLATPTNTEITDTTLISQLEAINNAISYNRQTNIDVISNVGSLDIDVSYYQKGE